MVLSSASVGYPRDATAAQITTLVQNDLGSIIGGSATINVCTNNNGVYHATSITTGACASANNTDGYSDPEPTHYVLATVDVSYPWQPPIPLWEFPFLHVHATLPTQTIHRTAAMRMIQ